MSLSHPLSNDQLLSSVQEAFHPWFSLDLIECLLSMTEQIDRDRDRDKREETYLAVRALFKPAIDQCPELLLCGLAQVWFFFKLYLS